MQSDEDMSLTKLESVLWDSRSEIPQAMIDFYRNHQAACRQQGLNDIEALGLLILYLHLPAQTTALNSEMILKALSEQPNGVFGWKD